MSRVISSAGLQAFFAAETDEVVLFLLKLSHGDWASDVFLVNNNENVTSNGDVYVPFPFDIRLPVESEDKPQATAKLRADNVDLQMVNLLRGVSTAITCNISIVLASQPSTIEYGPAKFLMKGVTYNASMVEATLTLEPILAEPIPKDTFTQAQFPGLF